MFQVGTGVPAKVRSPAECQSQEHAADSLPRTAKAGCFLSAAHLAGRIESRSLAWSFCDGGASRVRHTFYCVHVFVGQVDGNFDRHSGLFSHGHLPSSTIYRELGIPFTQPLALTPAWWGGPPGPRRTPYTTSLKTSLAESRGYPLSAISETTTCVPLSTSVASQSSHSSFSGELLEFVTIPSGPASRRTIALTRKVYSRRGGPRRERGAGIGKSPVAPPRHRASTRPAVRRRQPDRGGLGVPSQVGTRLSGDRAW